MQYARIIGAAIVATVFALSTVHGAERNESEGRQLYLRYCGACHGPEAKGNGIVAPTMRPAPADLTTIAARSGGEFRLEQVVKTIDGRELVHAHGEPRMPVWGTILSEELGSHGHRPAGIERRVQSHILSIAEYLRSIQGR